MLFLRGAQIPGATSPWRIHFVRRGLMSVGPHYGTSFELSFWHPELASRFLENLCTPVMANKNVKLILNHW
jgi:hypothetical protein